MLFSVGAVFAAFEAPEYLAVNVSFFESLLFEEMMLAPL